MIPYEAIGTGGVVGLAWLAQVLYSKRKANNGIPGKNKICIANGKMLTEHETVIKHLCTIQEKSEKTAETFRKENNRSHEKIIDKIDNLIGG